MKRFISSFLVYAALFASSAYGADYSIDRTDSEKPIIRITGSIEADDERKFVEISSGYDNAIVYLNSPGGSVRAGLGIGSQIAIRGYETYVGENRECYSICAIVWVGGSARRMHIDATIGVHAAYREVAQDDGSFKPQEVGSANAEIGYYLGELGLSREAVLYFTTAGPKDVFPVTPAIARRLDLAPFVWNGQRWETPTEYPSPRRLVQQAVRYSALSRNCSELLKINPDYLLEKGEERFIKGAEIYGNNVVSDLLFEFNEVSKNEMRAQGMVGWCISTEIALRDQGRQTGVAGPAFDCRKATTSTEQAICRSTDLWVMDRAMSNLYSLIRRHNPALDRAEFLNEQRDWLARRDTCGGDESCIKDLYYNRLLEFGI